MDYKALLDGIGHAHTHTLGGVAHSVNRALVARNWLVGAYLVEFEQQGEDRATYGSGLLKRVAKDLSDEGIPGCGVRMLERMRDAYLAYPQLANKISSPLVTNFHDQLITNDLTKSSPLVAISDRNQPHMPTPLAAERIMGLSWTHIIELVRIDDPWKRAFYENECLKGGWSKRQLQRQIATLLYERTGLSTNKQAVIERGRQQAPKWNMQQPDWISSYSFRGTK